jgi:thiamine kinase-like enzyme
MKQGFSGSTVQLKDNLVEKITNDKNFISSKERQKDLIALSHKIDILPRIERIAGRSIYMEYIEGQEELTEQNAPQAGKALRLLHEQHEYLHPCMTGLDWLIQMAQENLAQHNYGYNDFSSFKSEYPIDALIHSEPSQFIAKKDRTIVFIDIEGIGMGSRYQDLGYIYFRTMKEEKAEVFTSFMKGYQSRAIQIELVRIKRLAGLVAITYAKFAELEKRIKFGLQLLNETRY